MKQKLKLFSYWSSIIVIGIILGISLQFATAWVAPSATPPNGNIGAPINTSEVSQDKIGVLRVTNGFRNFGNSYLNGSVGIGLGDAAPTTALDVAGTVKLRNLSNCSGKLYTDASGNMACGTDNGANYTAGAGITISGGVISSDNSFGGLLPYPASTTCGSDYLVPSYKEETLALMGVYNNKIGIIYSASTGNCDGPCGYRIRLYYGNGNWSPCM